MKGKSEKIYINLFFLVYNLQISHKEEKKWTAIEWHCKTSKKHIKTVKLF